MYFDADLPDVVLSECLLTYVNFLVKANWIFMLASHHQRILDSYSGPVSSVLSS